MNAPTDADIAQLDASMKRSFAELTATAMAVKGERDFYSVKCDELILAKAATSIECDALKARLERVRDELQSYLTDTDGEDMRIQEIIDLVDGVTIEDRKRDCGYDGPRPAEEFDCSIHGKIGGTNYCPKCP